MRRQHLFFALVLVALLAACAQQPAAGYRIAYLSSRPNLPWDFLSLSSLRVALGAQSVQSWSEVLALHADEPLDGLVIDASAASQIDPAELGLLYRQCVVLAFFNLYSPAVAELVQDPTIREGGWMDGSQPYPGDFYIIVYRQASGSIGDCDGTQPTNSSSLQGGLSRGRSQYFLDTPADLQIFLEVFKRELAIRP
jgi:hypothetical protein